MIDSSVTSGMPFGYYIFRQEVPARALNAARYLGADGQLHDVVSGLATPTELFRGYKDLVMLFDLLADSAEAVTEQTRLYSMRGNFMSDHNAMFNLVKTSQEKFYLDGNILLGIFPESSLPGLADPSGLQQSVQRWSHALTQLSVARGWVEGKTNVLGFDREFLMLSQVKDPYFNSYDSFRDMLSTPTTGLLTAAQKSMGDAIGKLTTFKTNAADLLGRELRPYQRIYCSPLVDPYQPAEATEALMPGVLDSLLQTPPLVFVIQTRGPLILRDLARLQALAQRTHLRVSFSIPTDRDDIRRSTARD